MISPLPMDFTKEGRHDRHAARRVRLGAHDPHESEGGGTAKHTLFGFSRGRWEGTTLVVETDHIAAGYFDHEGTPQSDQIKTVERFIPKADYTPPRLHPDDNGSRQLHEALRAQGGTSCGSPRIRVYPYECLDRFEPGK
jgi:hypothetical protein